MIIHLEFLLLTPNGPAVYCTGALPVSRLKIERDSREILIGLSNITNEETLLSSELKGPSCDLTNPSNKLYVSFFSTHYD